MASNQSLSSAFGGPPTGPKRRWPVQQLFDACFSGDLAAVRDLVQQHKTSLIEKTDTAGDRPIQAAASEGHLEIVKFLVEAGMPFDRKGRAWTPLCDAASAGSLDVVKYLIAQGADVNAVFSKGSALMFALEHAYATDVAVYLIEQGAYVGPKIKDEDSKGVLHRVMEKDNAPVFSAMAKKGLLPKREQDAALDCAVYLAHLGMPKSGKISKIVAACISDAELSGEPDEMRLRDLAELTQDPETRGMLFSEATAAALREAIPVQAAGSSGRKRKDFAL